MTLSHQNQEIQREFSLTERDKIPSAVPVSLVGFKHSGKLLFKEANASGSSGTILAADTKKRRYIHAIQLAVIKNAASVSTSSYITFVLNGETKYFAIPTLSGVATQMTTQLTLTIPLEIDIGTAVAVSNQTNSADVKANGQIFYLEEDARQ